MPKGRDPGGEKMAPISFLSFFFTQLSDDFNRYRFVIHISHHSSITVYTLDEAYYSHRCDAICNNGELALKV